MPGTAVVLVQVSTPVLVLSQALVEAAGRLKVNVALVKSVLVADRDTASVWPMEIVWSGTVNTGGGGGRMINAKLLVVDCDGWLWSVTFTEMRLVPGAAALLVQVNTPFLMPVLVQVSRPLVVIQ